MKMPPLRLVLNSGSDSRREFADLSITAGFDDQAKLDAEAVYKTIRATTVERRYGDPEDLAVALVHKLLDSEPAITTAEVEIAANSWRRLGANAFEQPADGVDEHVDLSRRSLHGVARGEQVRCDSVFHALDAALSAVAPSDLP